MLRYHDRTIAAVALALPVLTLLAFMATAGAPSSYLLIDGGALVAALLWIALGQAPSSLRVTRVLAGLLVLLLFVPLATGPFIGGIARWLPLGSLTLHVGMFVVPTLVVLAPRDAQFGPLYLAAAILAALAQPDGGTAFGLTFAAVGIYAASQDWRYGLACIAGLLVAIKATLVGELPAQPFVEHILQQAAQITPLAAIALMFSLGVCFLLTVFALRRPRVERLALGGALFGFFIIALMNTYPYPLIGHGAASILGFGLAFGLTPKDQA